MYSELVVSTSLLGRAVGPDVRHSDTQVALAAVPGARPSAVAHRVVHELSVLPADARQWLVRLRKGRLLLGRCVAQ